MSRPVKLKIFNRNSNVTTWNQNEANVNLTLKLTLVIEASGFSSGCWTFHWSALILLCSLQTMTDNKTIKCIKLLFIVGLLAANPQLTLVANRLSSLHLVQCLFMDSWKHYLSLTVLCSAGKDQKSLQTRNIHKMRKVLNNLAMMQT